MAKKTSERGIKAIAIREGEVLHGYKDSKGLLTIGVGHLVTAGEPYKLHKPITKEESRRLLAIDLKEAEDAVNSIGIPILQNEFDALVSVTFNIGSAGFKRSSIVKRLKAHATRKQVAEAILLWNKPPEIQRRRQQEYAQFLTPYPDSAATPLEKTATSPTSDTTNDILQESSTETPPSPTPNEKITETEREVTDESGNKEVTNEKVVESFTPKNIPAFIPRFGKQWLLGLIPGAGMLSTWASYFAGLPQWVVFLMGFLTGITIVLFVQLLLRHRVGVQAFIIRCYESMANPAENNLIPTPAPALLARGERREALQTVLGLDESI